MAEKLRDLQKLVGSVISGVLSGKTPTESLMHVAVSEELSPPEIELVAANVNKSRALVTFYKGSDEDRLSVFPLAEASEIISHMAATQKKETATPAATVSRFMSVEERLSPAIQKAACTQGSVVPKTSYLEEEALEYAAGQEQAALADCLQKAAEIYEKDVAVGKALLHQAMLETVNDVRAMSGGDRSRFLRRIVNRFGGFGSAVAGNILHSAGLTVETVPEKTAGSAVFPASPEYVHLQKLLHLAQTQASRIQSLELIKHAAAGGSDSFMEDFLANSAALMLAPTMMRDSKIVNTLQVGNEMRREDKAPAAEDLSMAIGAKLQGLRTRRAFMDAVMNDPTLREHPFGTLTQAFNDAVQLDPTILHSPPKLRSYMVQMLGTGGVLDSFQIAQATATAEKAAKLNKMMRDERMRSVDSMASIMDARKAKLAENAGRLEAAGVAAQEKAKADSEKLQAQFRTFGTSVAGAVGAAKQHILSERATHMKGVKSYASMIASFGPEIVERTARAQGMSMPQLKQALIDENRTDSVLFGPSKAATEALASIRVNLPQVKREAEKAEQDALRATEARVSAAGSFGRFTEDKDDEVLTAVKASLGLQDSDIRKAMEVEAGKTLFSEKERIDAANTLSALRKGIRTATAEKTKASVITDKKVQAEVNFLKFIEATDSETLANALELSGASVDDLRKTYEVAARPQDFTEQERIEAVRISHMIKLWIADQAKQKASDEKQVAATQATRDYVGNTDPERLQQALRNLGRTEADLQRMFEVRKNPKAFSVEDQLKADQLKRDVDGEVSRLSGEAALAQRQAAADIKTENNQVANVKAYRDYLQARNPENLEQALANLGKTQDDVSRMVAINRNPSGFPAAEQLEADQLRRDLETEMKKVAREKAEAKAEADRLSREQAQASRSAEVSKAAEVQAKINTEKIRQKKSADAVKKAISSFFEDNVTEGDLQSVIGKANQKYGKLTSLYEDSINTDLPIEDQEKAKYTYGEALSYIATHAEGISKAKKLMAAVDKLIPAQRELLSGGTFFNNASQTKSKRRTFELLESYYSDDRMTPSQKALLDEFMGSLDEASLSYATREVWKRLQDTDSSGKPLYPEAVDLVREANDDYNNRLQATPGFDPMSTPEATVYRILLAQHADGGDKTLTRLNSGARSSARDSRTEAQTAKQILAVLDNRRGEQQIRGLMKEALNQMPEGLPDLFRPV